MAAKKRGLGRGLDALLSSGGDRVVKEDWNLRNIDIERIYRSPYQPRQRFNEAALQDLADSIKAQGVIQPVVVRPKGDGYELIAGERRWRAAQLAGVAQVPAVVRRITDNEAAAMALIENIQREDLNPLEQAQGMRRLLDEFGLTHQQLADALGRSRSAISNILRLLELAQPVKDLLAEGRLEMGHARALLPLSQEQQVELGQRISARGYTVREIEVMVRQLLAAMPERKTPQRKDANIQRLEEELGQRLGAGINITHNKKGKGKLVISYDSLDQLDGILSHIR